MRRRNTEQPIIIKKGKGHKHDFHGGNWKVALADFMTTMFIFFLMMWLLNIVSKEQREGIADYFSPASVSRSTSGSGAVLGGQTISKDGTFVSPGGPPQIVPGSGAGDAQIPDLDLDPVEDQDPIELTQEHIDLIREFLDALGPKGPDEGGPDDRSGKGSGQEPITQIPQQFVGPEGTEIVVLPDGLKIIIKDLEDEPMFASGSDQPTPRTVEVLQAMAPLIEGLDSDVRVVGHTDAVPYRAGPTGSYSNWELSADRANAARRVLVRSGLQIERMFEVSGKGPSEPLDEDDPNAAQNRRLEIMIVFPRDETEQAGASQPMAPQPVVTSSPLSPDARRNGISGGNGGRTGGGPLQTPTRLVPRQQ